MDIVVTIPKEEYLNDDAETKALQEDPAAMQFWKVARMPKKLKKGDRIYFIRDGKIESSMQFLGGGRMRRRCDVTDRAWDGILLFMNDLRLEENPMPAKGFQGFRYRWWKSEQEKETEKKLMELAGILFDDLAGEVGDQP